MSAPVIQNFRGRHALVVHMADANCTRLVATLGRLGLVVEVRGPADAETALAANTYDVVFFDADEGSGSVFAEALPDTPLIALIGIEAPSRLVRVVRQRAAAYIMKPVRSSGIFTALFVAFNEHAWRHREAETRQSLERRTAGRRDLVRAIITIIKQHDVDDEEAFQRLRRESMRRRVAIEVVAKEVLAEARETSLGRFQGREPIKRKLRSDRR